MEEYLGTDEGQNIIDVWLRNPLMSESVEQLIQITCGMAIILAVMFYLINLAYNYASTVLEKLQGGGEAGFVNYKELIRVFVLIGCILIYPLLAKAINSGVDFARFLSSMDASMYEEYNVAAEGLYTEMERNTGEEAMTQEAIDHILNNKDMYDDDIIEKAELLDILEETEDIEGETSKGETDNFWSFLQYLKFLNPAVLGPSIAGGVIGLLSQIIKYVILGLSMILYQILLILGPLAFSFSIIPMFKDKLEEWFATLLTIGFVFVTYNILDALMATYVIGMFENLENFSAGVDSMLIFQLVMLITYIMIFWLTSKYVGKSEAGRFMTKFVSLATLAVTSAMAGGATAAAGGAAKAGGLSSAVQSGGDAFKPE